MHYFLCVIKWLLQYVFSLFKDFIEEIAANECQVSVTLEITVCFLQAYCDQADQENEKADNTDVTPVASEKKRKLDSSENKDTQSPETPSNKKQTLTASDNTKSRLAAFAAS